jgi:hypothetical protein
VVTHHWWQIFHGALASLFYRILRFGILGHSTEGVSSV